MPETLQPGNPCPHEPGRFGRDQLNRDHSVRGLDHEDAARFSFLLATPIIFAAGVYKVPDLMGHLGNNVRGQALVGSVFAGIAAYASVRFLMRFFETRTLLPFAIYSLAFGALSIIRFA